SAFRGSELFAPRALGTAYRFARTVGVRARAILDMKYSADVSHLDHSRTGPRRRRAALACYRKARARPAARRHPYRGIELFIVSSAHDVAPAQRCAERDLVARQSINRV